MSIDSMIERDDGLEAILKRFAAVDPEETVVDRKDPEREPDAREEPDEDDEPERHEDDHDGHDEPDEDHEEPEETPAEAAERLADDDHLVQIGEAKIKVAELKRLHGLEAELTTKTQRVTQEGEKAATILGALIQKAQQDYAPYAKIDWVDARAKLDDAAYNQLKTDYQAVHNHLAFLTQEQNAFLTQVQQNRAAMIQERLKACDAALATDPETKGWDATARNELQDYAIKSGMDPNIAKSIADPRMVKLAARQSG